MATNQPFPYLPDTKEGEGLSNLPPEDQAIILQKEGGVFEHAHKVKEDVEEILNSIKFKRIKKNQKIRN